MVDGGGEYFGAVDLKDLIVARDYMDLESLVTTSYPYVYAGERTDECIEELREIPRTPYRCSTAGTGF